MKRGWKIFWIVCGVCAGVGLVCCSIAFMMGVTIETIERHFPDGIGIVSDRKDYRYDDYDDIDDIIDDMDDDYDMDDDEDVDDIDDYDDMDDMDNSGYNGHHGNVPGDGYHAGGGAMNAVTNKGSSKKIIYGTGKQDFTGVDSIDAYMWGGFLEVDNETASSDVISVETDNISEKLGLRCYMDGNELKLVTKKKVIGVGKKKAGKVIIHMPYNYQLREAELELVAGSLHIKDICASELSIGVGAGEGVVKNFTATEVDLDCGAGSLIAAGNAMTEAEIDCGVGEIVYTAAGKEKDYNYEIDCGVGEIVCGEMRYSGIGTSKTISNNAAKHMDISCGIGSVTVNFS